MVTDLQTARHLRNVLQSLVLVIEAAAAAATEAAAAVTTVVNLLHRILDRPI